MKKEFTGKGEVLAIKRGGNPTRPAPRISRRHGDKKAVEISLQGKRGGVGERWVADG